MYARFLGCSWVVSASKPLTSVAIWLTTRSRTACMERLSSKPRGSVRHGGRGRKSKTGQAPPLVLQLWCSFGASPFGPPPSQKLTGASGQVTQALERLERLFSFRPVGNDIEIELVITRSFCVSLEHALRLGQTKDGIDIC